ncbi:MAG: cyclodeaminase/cyclohydrolase family protein [Dehalococcoidia bacterium]|nr:cyclodeaminase/cyclohydrolase family protein [Dehalococcoidia bacterium]
MPELTVNSATADFLEALASSAPTPGGGSVAALTGALGAGLISMVCNLTLGKEKYKDVEAEVARLLEESEGLRRELMRLIEADMGVYGKLSAAYRLPKDTDQDKALRTAAIQAALVEATGVPMAIARACARVVDLCPTAAKVGNLGAISDVGVAVLLGEAALRSAALNVAINLGTLKDQAFVETTRRELEKLVEDKPELKELVYQDVMARL